MTSTSDIRQTFFQECDELLEALSDGLMAIEEATAEGIVDAEVVNAVFRAVHSIKGGAAAFGLKQLVSFAHTFENMLDDLRAGRIAATETLAGLSHLAADHLSDLVRAARDGTELEGAAGDEMCRRLAEACAPRPPAAGTGSATPAGAPAAPPAVEPAPEPLVAPDVDPDEAELIYSFVPLGLALPGPDAAGTPCWEIGFRPEPGLFASGNDPVHLFRELAALGQMSSSVDLDAMPPLCDLDPHHLELDWHLRLETDAEEAEIREIFDFVAGLCHFDMVLADPALAAAPPAAPPGKGEDPAAGSIPAGPTGSADRPGQAAPGAVPGIAAEEAPPRAAPEDGAPRPGAGKTSAARATVRVDLELVDRLINMVGELVINQAVLTQCVQDAGLTHNGQLTTSLTDLKNLTREIQENVMAIRAQPVKPLFQRMARIVREASDLAGKPAHFVTLGEATEVDKTVIEQLVDPLTHMIRNAVDHGLESTERRRESGKPETGTVTLSAAHRSGRVVIEVSDNGAGINRAKVLDIARRKGLVPADADLSESEIDNLLFLPGFSTASSVTDLSGRGVGLDVVKSAIRKLGGRVAVTSVPGRGTTMSISLPLTLAVLEGMVVDVAGQTMVVPITAIVETMRPSAASIHELGASGRVVKVRDRFVPVIDLGLLFGHRDQTGLVMDMVLLLVETDAKETFALAVDRIHDQRQIVIKGLETNYGHVPCVAAATILGDGKIALIIDPEETAAMGRLGHAAPRNLQES
jgi:two-component system chemotaxis sensor kinase CheA